ncbi:MAG TPA: D-alanyl-D-alanine carboxypeptidase/D-alanyl-D-alanine-endopeptidase, partial [Firmicutes bacterium]|nr:D-alanyl-D-alanine carboxypeptidase/D-alanyl-D-alanine-endopeptidase [Bacillota bacterium]
VTVWRTVPDPVAYAGSVFRTALIDAGVTIGDSLIVATAPDSNTTTLAVIHSASLDVLIRRFLKKSHNLTGEALLKHLGTTFRGTGSWECGLQATRSILHTFAGIDSTTYRLADGSGLSRYTEISPRVLATLLRAASDEFTMAPEIFAAMPIAGVDGTLARRLSEDPIAGTVRGKTGSMTGVSSLAGVLETREGEKLVYCLLMNGFPGSSWAAREMQDRIVSHLRELPCVSEQSVCP